jgi:hypothetical protein
MIATDQLRAKWIRPNSHPRVSGQSISDYIHADKPGAIEPPVGANSNQNGGEFMKQDLEGMT